MAFPSVTYSITNNTPNDATQVMQNFTDCINAMKDGTKDFNISAFTSNGATTLGASSANDLIVNASLASSIPIKTNTTYPIGSSTKGLDSVYLGGSSTFTVRIKAATMAASYTFTLPAAVPTTTGVLVMDASGNVTNGTGGPQNLNFQTATPGTALVSDANRFYPGGTTGPGLSIVTADGAPGNRTVAVVTGSSSTGFPIVVSAKPSSHGLMFVRGGVTSAGAVSWGEGFSVVRNSLGLYTITWSVAFADAPSLAILPNGYSIYRYNSLGTGSAQVEFANNTLSSNADENFSFIAMGQRGA